MTSLQEQLFQLQDTKYRDFHSKLIPNIDKERVIGIRTPMLRQFAKEFWKNRRQKTFWRSCRTIIMRKIIFI